MVLDEFGDDERYQKMKRAAFHEGNDQALVAFALIEVARAIQQSGQDISYAIQKLGIARETEPPGAIEALSREISDGSERLAVAIGSLAKGKEGAEKPT